MKSKFKKGDRVVMHTCGESDFPKYKGKIWECEDDSFKSRSGHEVVFLIGFSGTFITKYLQIVDLEVECKKAYEAGAVEADLNR